MCQMSIHQNIKCIKYTKFLPLELKQVFTVIPENSSEKKFHIHYFLAQVIVHHQSDVEYQEGIIDYLGI